MAEQVLMLALSPTMEEGTIVKWHKKEGDAVAQSEIICEVETDKATMEYESVNEGTLLKILVADGGQAKVGDPIAVVGEPGEDFAELLAAAVDSAAVDSAAVDSAAVDSAAGPASAVQAKAVPAAPAAQGRAIKSSPLARKMAAEQGIDLRSVQGSGPGGRIVKRDIEKLQLRPEAGAPPAVAQPAIPVSAPVITPESAADERIPVSGKRKIIAQRLAESKFSAPHFYLRLEVDAGSMMKARERLNARLVNDPAGKVSPNAFLIKFAAEALRRHPVVNSSWQGDSILRHGSIDIGLAVAQEDGLITPVVRNCAGKGILAIDRELKELVDKARNNRLTPEQYSGATFTISSLGTYGITEFTAIINPPGSAILAVGSIRKVPVVGQNDEVNIQSQMILTLSCDHRVVDGATGAAFLAELKRYVENPVEVLY